MSVAAARVQRVARETTASSSIRSPLYAPQIPRATGKWSLPNSVSAGQQASVRRTRDFDDRPGQSLIRQRQEKGTQASFRSSVTQESSYISRSPQAALRPNPTRRDGFSRNTQHDESLSGSSHHRNSPAFPSGGSLLAKTVRHSQRPLTRNSGNELLPPRQTPKVARVAPTLNFSREPSSLERQNDSRRKTNKSSRGSLLAMQREIGDEAQTSVLPTKKAKGSKASGLKVQVKDINKDVFIPSAISVGNLSRLLNVRQDRLQRQMQIAGMTETSYDHLLSSDDASLLALEFDRNPVVDDEAAFDLYPSPRPTDEQSLPLRPPIITIMGHVDHGKTTLLDTLRSTSVAAGEAGGITQHIGAFSVPVRSLAGSSEISSDRSITFLDTPGHAAFTAMRARGAGVTDIIVLVVAADDGVMPQTKEVIELAKKEGNGDVCMVVAINKCDKHGADVTKVKHSLLAAGVELEEFGGDIPAVEVSGLTGKGLDTLVETISTLAEVKELRARQDGNAEGFVIESRVDKGKGPVATVLVTRGTLVPSNTIIAGTTWARVRQMTDSSGTVLKRAGPGMPVTISGWKEVPLAGDEVLAAEESKVKTALANRLRMKERNEMMADVERINEKRKGVRESGEADAENVAAKSEDDVVKELRLIIKADVSGTVEAVVGSLEGIGNKIAKVKIVQSGVGDVTDSDISMAKAVDGMIVGFSVQAPAKVLATASRLGVSVYTESVIYRLMEHIRSRVQALLPVVIEKRVTGEATIQQVFEIKLKGKDCLKIAGCRVGNGLIERSKRVRIIRCGEEVYDGSVESLKHLKKEISEARKGTECGISLTNFTNAAEGDLVQCYEVIETPGCL